MSLAITRKHILAAAIAACVVALALSLSLGAGKAWAGAQPGHATLEDLDTKTYVVSYKGAVDNGMFSYYSNEDPRAEISAARSSNEGVATVEVQHQVAPGHESYVLLVRVKKAGTTTISYAWGGERHKVKYVVKKYENPLGAFKVGTANCKKLFAPKAIRSSNGGYTFAGAGAGALSGKLKVKPAKGWEVVKAWYWAGNEMSYVKSGQEIPNGAQTLYVWLQSGTQREVLYLYCSPANG